jgi:hypothetical protein
MVFLEKSLGLVGSSVLLLLLVLLLVPLEVLQDFLGGSVGLSWGGAAEYSGDGSGVLQECFVHSLNPQPKISKEQEFYETCIS